MSEHRTIDDRPVWERIVPCRSCKARIVWFRTPKGKLMPVDAEPATVNGIRYAVEVGDVRYEKARHMPHFATCPDGPRWSRPKKAGPRPTPDFETKGLYGKGDD